MAKGALYPSEEQRAAIAAGEVVVEGDRKETATPGLATLKPSAKEFADLVGRVKAG